MTMLETVRSTTTPTMRRRALVLVARLRRLLNSWVAAATANREPPTAPFALRPLNDRELDNRRIYRGPIDQAFEKLGRLHNWRKQP